MANDAYTEGQDPFFLRAGRMNAYSKIAMLALLVPITVSFIVGSGAALVQSCRAVPPPNAEEEEGPAARVGAGAGGAVEPVKVKVGDEDLTVDPTSAANRIPVR
mmetsp:Transcript_53373/g.172368  ORF Transcript_53373/g.172368 Transcript_53373/m.172368 type:complete len:104 (-) Transcript_53373:59-370(-)